MHYGQMGVSKNRDTSKWMVYNGKPYQNGWFGGTPIFGHTQIRHHIFLKAIIFYSTFSFMAMRLIWMHLWILWSPKPGNWFRLDQKWTVLKVETFRIITWDDSICILVWTDMIYYNIFCIHTNEVQSESISCVQCEMRSYIYWWDPIFFQCLAHFSTLHHLQPVSCIATCGPLPGYTFLTNHLSLSYHYGFDCAQFSEKSLEVSVSATSKRTIPVMRNHNLWLPWKLSFLAGALSFYSVLCTSGTIFDPSFLMVFAHFDRGSSNHYIYIFNHN